MTERFSMALPAELTTPRAAREAVQRRFGAEPRCGDLLLCVSEVVTNAVRHAQTSARLTVSRDRDIVTVEVSDASPDLPVRRPASASSTTGRGLQILDQLARRWGARPTADGKVVWFEIDLTRAT